MTDGDGPTPRERSLIDVRTLDLGGDVLIVTDREGTITDVNDAFVQVTGYSRAEAIGQSPRMLSSGYQDQAFYEDMWQTILDGRVWYGQLVDRRRDGSLRTYHSTISPMKDTAGRVTHFVAVERDVTADLGRQAALGPTGLVHTDVRTNIVYADPQAERLLGAPHEGLLGRGLHEHLRAEDASAFAEVVEAVCSTGRAHRVDLRPRGGEYPLHAEIAPLTVASGALIGTACLLEDLSEHVGTHRELDRRDTLLASVLDALPDAVMIVASDGVVLAVNRAWRETARHAPDDPLVAVQVGDDFDARMRDALASGDTSAMRLIEELRHQRETGEDPAGAQVPVDRDDPDPPPPVGDTVGDTTPDRSAPTRRFAVTPLAWDEGGSVVRLLPEATR